MMCINLHGQMLQMLLKNSISQENFTTFIGYEFTTSTDVEGGNLHRNVIFDSSKAPIRPWTRIDSLNPEDLWTWMDGLRDKASILWPCLTIAMALMAKCLK